MTGRERFTAIMDYQPFDRMPVLWFDFWSETGKRWLDEGLSVLAAAPEETGMDPDWERGMWSCHGLVSNRLLTTRRDEVIEETAQHKIVRTAFGAVLKYSKDSETMPQHLEEALKPTRESWNEFKKCMDPRDPARVPADRDAKIAALNGREHATCFLGGSLFGWPRDWMGVEQISYLSYDDPALYEEIISTIVDFFIELHRPFLKNVQFEFAYFFEDCCGKSGPLLSPDAYRRFYHKHYVRLIEFYRACGVKHILLDSDGYVDPLIPCWMDSGIDILFPIEVGTWKASPVEMRRKYGRNLRMFGGVDKHVIAQGPAAIRQHLAPLVPVAMEGGYIPIPDHRIPPSVSLEQFREYVRIFKEVFAK